MFVLCSGLVFMSRVQVARVDLWFWVDVFCVYVYGMLGMICWCSVLVCWL